ncbi:hypothetical protein CIPAW_14G076200 [Carya illinoinensis]|uniref:Uncharacterized protein n=1 Tax=Carya illinoinensis TaxID=32201 RepID=A0A8T1NK89_CARIL|nr:hypothetical protein CIPAW_14G076200 [Carya illinoinensis]
MRNSKNCSYSNLPLPNFYPSLALCFRFHKRKCHEREVDSPQREEQNPRVAFVLTQFLEKYENPNAHTKVSSFASKPSRKVSHKNLNILQLCIPHFPSHSLDKFSSRDWNCSSYIP